MSAATRRVGIKAVGHVVGRRAGSSSAFIAESGNAGADHDSPLWDQQAVDDIGREARGSPAALFGTKRIGLVAVNEKLNSTLQTKVSGKLLLP